jgi:hypothetical protein
MRSSQVADFIKDSSARRSISKAARKWIGSCRRFESGKESIWPQNITSIAEQLCPSQAKSSLLPHDSHWASSKYLSWKEAGNIVSPILDQGRRQTFSRTVLVAIALQWRILYAWNGRVTDAIKPVGSNMENEKKKYTFVQC